MGHISTHAVTNVHTHGLVTEKKLEPLKLEECTKETYFPGVNGREAELYKTGPLYCLTEESKKKANIVGCQSCDSHSHIQLNIHPCKQSHLKSGESCLT